jgi:hypothetical protein
MLHYHSCELTNGKIESQHLVHQPSTASKYSSKLTCLWPLSWQDCSLQVYLQTRSITDSQCISKPARLWPPNTLNQVLQVYIQPRLITAYKYIFKHAEIWPPCASLYSLDHGLQVYPNSLDYCRHVHMILASKCTSKLAQSQSPSVSLNLHHYGLQVHTSIVCKFA